MFGALLPWLGLSPSLALLTGALLPTAQRRHPSPRDWYGQQVYYVLERDTARKGHAIDGHRRYHHPGHPPQRP